MTKGEPKPKESREGDIVDGVGERNEQPRRNESNPAARLNVVRLNA